MTSNQTEHMRATGFDRSGTARLKTALNAYSFTGALKAGELDLFDVLRYCAEHDFDGLDATGYFFPGYPDVPDDSYLNDFKRRAFLLGIDVSGTGVKNDFAQPDAERRAADVRLTKQWIECAARLGAPVIRVFAGPEPAGRARDEVADWMATDLRECAEHGARFGVMVGVQNHGDFLKTADQTLDLLRRVDHEWFGIIVDTGHFTTQDPYDDIARLAPYAVNWQLKEKMDGKNGNVRVDTRRIVDIARAAGYRGYLPIETLAPDGEAYDPRARAAELLQELRHAIR